MKDINYISKEENERRRDYYEFCKVLEEVFNDDEPFDDDDIPDTMTGMTYGQMKYGDDYDNFTGDIIRSSRTETIKEQPIKKSRKRN